jgi:ferredoxin|tara:strand:- start:593 stop:790 length:198 start_codon:yes stop_codon:yes gene_type:complete
MTLIINYDRCIKTGECYRVYPEMFKARPDGFPDVLNSEPQGEDYEDALDAVRSCPGYAVRLEDEA